MNKLRNVRGILFFAVLAAVLMMAGCSGDNGAPGTSTGTVSGTVTPATATITFAANGATVATATASGGSFSAKVPIGVYDVTFSATGYTSATVNNVSVIAGKTTTMSAQALTAAAAAAATVTATTTGTVAPGNTVTVSLAPSTSTISSVTWSVLAGPIDSTGASTLTVTPVATPAAATTTTDTSVTVKLPSGLTDYINQYFNVLNTERGIVNETTGAYEGVVLARNMVMGIDPQDLTAMGAVTLEAKVTLASGDTVTQDVSLAADLSYTDQAGTSSTFNETTGLRNVPINVPVLLHAAAAPTTGQTWTVTAPTGSAVTKLQDATLQNAYFTPDVEGEYVVKAPDGTEIDVYGGTWGMAGVGVIGGIDANGNPTASSTCNSCHTSAMPDWTTIFGDWATTGHAHKFSDGLDGGGHYNNGCFSCHTVGYNTNAVNNGFDDLPNYDAMYAAFFPNGSPGAAADNSRWPNMVAQYPAVASMANIQCENCHGPNTSPAHVATTDAASTARFSLSADLCGRCHGEPTHHPSYQLWQRGAYGQSHANVALASQHGLEVDSATTPDFGATDPYAGNYDCAGCHTAQGALAWINQLEGNGQTADASHYFTATTMADSNVAAMTTDNAQPQTCQVCHDPHNVGRDVADTKVRVEDNTPMLPAGFAATGVGKGAMCFICHNSRNGEDPASPGTFGLHEDGDPVFGTLTSYQVAHHSAQGDVLMGRNAYFIAGTRSPHSLISDTCVNCHMEQVPAPADLAGSGATPNNPANHTFTADVADPSTSDFCANCHGAGFNRVGLQATVESLEGQLVKAMLYDAYRQAETGATSGVYATWPVFSSTDTFTYNDGSASGTVTNAAGDTATLTINYAGPKLVVTPATGTAETFYASLPSSPAATDNLLPFNDTLAKAVWNYSLIDNDQSYGVHNPNFVQQLLSTTSAQVVANTP